MFCAPRLIFGGIGGIGSRFHVLRSRAHFLRLGWRPVPFSCFALSDMFSAVRSTSGPVFMFCAPRPVFMFCPPGLIFDGTEGVGSRSHVLRSRTHFRRYRGRRTRFHVLRARTHFRRYQWRRVPFSCFALPKSFPAVPRASCPVYMFCVPGFIFSGTEGVRSRFHDLRSLTRFRRYRGRRIPFSCFARPDSILAAPRASNLIFLFCAPGVLSRGTEGVRSYFHVFRSRTTFRRYRGRRVPISCFALPESIPAVPKASGPVFTFCSPRLVFGGTDGVGSISCFGPQSPIPRYRGR
jgi:hypothetical protein